MMGERTPLLGDGLEKTSRGKTHAVGDFKRIRDTRFQTETSTRGFGDREAATTDDTEGNNIRTCLHTDMHVRPRSAPPESLTVSWDNSHRSARPHTSLGHSLRLGDEGLGEGLNHNSSDENVDEEFVNRETNNETGTGKANILNIFLMNIIIIIWSIAVYINGPVWSQYFFRRVENEVFGNASNVGSNRTAKTVCYKPFPNATKLGGSYSLEEKAQQLSTKLIMEYTFTGTPLALVSTIIVSAYSDYFGRKVLFLIPMFGNLITYAISTIIIHWSLSINLFFVTSVIGGICSSEIFNIACLVYITDNTPPEGSRTVGLVAMGLTMAFTNAALATGVGYYIQLKGYFLPALTASVIILLGVLAVIVILPETKPVPTDSASRKRQLKEKKALNPLKAVKNVFQFYFFDGTIKTRIMYIILLLAIVFRDIAGKTGNINTLWEMTYPLCWSPEMMGYYGTAGTIFSQIIKLPLLKLFQCCLNDELIAIWSNIAYTGALVLKAFSYDNLMMYGVAFVGAFDISVISAIQSTMSKMAGPERQGALFGSLAIVSLICSLIGTPVFSEIYQYTVDIFRGVSYLVLAGLQCVATALVITYVILSKRGYHQTVEHIGIHDNGTTREEARTSRDDESNV